MAGIDTTTAHYHLRSGPSQLFYAPDIPGKIVPLKILHERQHLFGANGFIFSSQGHYFKSVFSTVAKYCCERFSPQGILGVLRLLV